MIDFSSIASLVTNGSTASIARLGPHLIRAAVFALLPASLLLHQVPTAVAERAVHWLGIAWSNDALTSWLEVRGDAVQTLGLLIATVAISGVLRLGATRWLGSTHAPFGLVLGLVFLVEGHAPTTALVLAILAAPIASALSERSLGSGAIVLVFPPVMYLSAPVLITAELLGINRAIRELHADQRTSSTMRAATGSRASLEDSRSSAGSLNLPT